VTLTPSQIFPTGFPAKRRWRMAHPLYGAALPKWAEGSALGFGASPARNDLAAKLIRVDSHVILKIEN